MSKLADYGLSIQVDLKRFWLIRNGRSVRIMALQRELLERLLRAEQERDQLAALVVELRSLNDGLDAQRASALQSLTEAEAEIKRLQSAQPSAEVIPLWEGPVRIAPRYLNVPVSEALFRWLEASGDRNRRSADDMARALLVAFMRAAGNREAA